MPNKPAEPSPEVAPMQDPNGDCPTCGDPDHFAWAFTECPVPAVAPRETQTELTGNSKVLADFTAYCEDNPSQRFWQALRNWANVGFVMVSNDRAQYFDTFYREGKDADGLEGGR